MRLGTKPYRDIIYPVPPCWNDISIGWYKSLLLEAEEMESEITYLKSKLTDSTNPGSTSQRDDD